MYLYCSQNMARINNFLFLSKFMVKVLRILLQEILYFSILLLKFILFNYLRAPSFAQLNFFQVPEFWFG